ncbi:MFS transporter [Nonomuraea sp. NPDC050783]|uniref:MFS transporter n=1 Tax=Nonomuraea sp. NPDC050783 TaxID=3154634 RepID=UPI003465C06C
MTETLVPTLSRARWLAVSVLALGTFTLVTSEMLPVGLLTSIASDLGVSPGTAGLTMSAPGLVAAVCAPLLAVAARRADRRILLLALMALLALADLAAALAPGLAVMLAARVVTGVSIGGFWAFAAGLGARLAPERHVGRATSIILGGVSVASVLGVPAATFVSSYAGWRAAFAAMGVLALAVLALLATTLPPLPGEAAARPAGRGPRLSGPLALVLVLTVLIIAGHFAAYTYVRPFLEQVAQAGPGLVGVALLAYGAAGVLGNFAAGARAARSPGAVLVVLALLIALGTAALSLTGLPLAALVLWGLGYGGVGVALQLWIMRSGGGEWGTALFVSAFNVSIALGSLVGGRVTDEVSVTAAMWPACVLSLLAAAVAAAGTWGRSRTSGS